MPARRAMAPAIIPPQWPKAHGVNPKHMTKFLQISGNERTKVKCYFNSVWVSRRWATSSAFVAVYVRGTCDLPVATWQGRLRRVSREKEHQGISSHGIEGTEPVVRTKVQNVSWDGTTTFISSTAIITPVGNIPRAVDAMRDVCDKHRGRAGALMVEAMPKPKLHGPRQILIEHTVY